MLQVRSVFYRDRQAVVLVADSKTSLKVTGLGDVLAPNGGVIGERRLVAFSVFIALATSDGRFCLFTPPCPWP